MQLHTSFTAISEMLRDEKSSNAFFATLAAGEEFEIELAPEERDIRLALAVYDTLHQHSEDQTYFGIQACQLIAHCVEHFRHPTVISKALKEYLGDNPAFSASKVLSFYITFSFVAREYDELLQRLGSYLDQQRSINRADSTLLMAIRSLLIMTRIVFSRSDYDALPLPARIPLQRNVPMEQCSELAASLETLLRGQARSIRKLDKQVSYCLAERPKRILFAVDDFVDDDLNTLTKMYCDFLFVLAKFSDISLAVRVYSITNGYSNARMPAIWDPPIGKLSKLFKAYFGEEEAKVSRSIDFAHVNIWANGDTDYVGAVADDIRQMRPDICVTCLERPYSFLEATLYELVPLLQIEVINGSGFVRNCDALIPNGTPSAERARQFNCVSVPLPQIPYPVLSKVSKDALGFSESQYVLAVVAKEFPRRLLDENKLELSKAFAAALTELQKRYEDLGLLLVGETEMGIQTWFEDAQVSPDWQRLRVIPFAQDLRGVMQACDLIVNPPARGGARGMAIAISDRLPVLVFSDADATNFVPTENICSDIVDFTFKVGYYHALGCGFRSNYVSTIGHAPFSEAYNRHSAKSFVDAATVAQEVGEARLRGEYR